jgi:hypothetical protein
MTQPASSVAAAVSAAYEGPQATRLPLQAAARLYFMALGTEWAPLAAWPPEKRSSR